MLLKFRFSNFRSFRTEQELSLIAGPVTGSQDGVFSPSGFAERVLPVAAIYGANASGKTAVISALGFMGEIVKWSHSRWQPDEPVPMQPFAAESETAPSEFAADFLLGGIRHQYGFRANSQAILGEWLYVYPKGKPQLWFRRTEDGPISFGTKMAGENRTIEALTRKNSLFLSAAAQNNHEALSPIYNWFSNFLFAVLTGGLRIYGINAAKLCQDDDDRAMISALLSHADLGISELRVEKVPLAALSRKVIEAIHAELPPNILVPAVSETREEIRLLHRIGDQIVPFEMAQESNGTLVYLKLLGPIVSALRNGGVLCVDELDQSLHPLIVLEVIRLFNNPATNPKSAQLIFNTHDTNLLSSGVLRRDQVWFTEKDTEGCSHLYPLTDYKPRRQENLENGYLQGRYGAIPFIHPDFLAVGPDGDSAKT